MVVLNENISAARDFEKMQNKRVDAFGPTEKGYLGGIDPEKITLYLSANKLHTTASEFNVYDLDELPQVDFVHDYAGFDPAICS